MWSAALGLAGSVAGAIGAASAARSAAKAAMYDSQQRRLSEAEAMNLARYQMGLGEDAARREQEQAKLYQSYYDRNSALALDQRNYGRGLVAEDRATADAERLQELDRLRNLDVATAREYERRRQEIERAQGQTMSERRYALDALEAAQRTARSERGFEESRLLDDRARAERERQFGIEELRGAQANARIDREFDLRRLDEGSRFAQSERATALRYLDESAARAASERSFDEAQLRRAQEQKAAEREFQLQEYGAARSQALAERNDDLFARDLQRAATERMSAALQSALDRMGEQAPADLMGRADINAETARRDAQATADIDKLITASTSANEAQLIRRGVDDSSTGQSLRAELAAKLTPEIMNMRNQARDAAVRYVTGANEALRLAPELERLRRQSVLGEIQTAYGAAAEGYGRERNVRSALDGMQFGNVGSGVYERDLVSANDFRGPLDVGSGFYQGSVRSMNDYRSPVEIGSTILERDLRSANSYDAPVSITSGYYDAATGSLGSGLFEQNFPTRTQRVGAYNADGTYQYVMPQLTGPSSYMTGASGLVGNVMTSRSNAASASQGLATQAAGAVGGAFRDLFAQGGSLLDGISQRKQKASDFSGWLSMGGT